MRDLVVKDPTHKKATLLQPIILPDGTIIPAGTVLVVDLEYLNPALDNDPTENNKANMLDDITQEMLGMPPDSDNYVGTVNLAFRSVVDMLQKPQQSTFQQLMTGRFI